MLTDPSYPSQVLITFGMILNKGGGCHGHDVLVGGAEAQGTEG